RGIPGLKLKMPHILGSDISGVVESIGDNIDSSDIGIGDRVLIDPSLSCMNCEFCTNGEITLCNNYGIIGEHKRGGYAEFISVAKDNIISVPKNVKLSYEELAAVPLTFMTAYRMLKTRARIGIGEDILIIGIGGGVALAAMEIAKLFRARVFVTSSSDTKLKKAKDLGADFTINYKKSPEFFKEVLELTNGRGVDIVVDSAGQASWKKSLRSLRKGGKYVTCGATTGSNVELNLNVLFWKQFDILGSTMGTRKELREVLRFVWKGHLNPIIDTVLPLSEARKAHSILESGQQFGKIVLKV
ncbi:MAG: zinc-binding dehydrogenase, partial [Candidatus Hodarchaeales archaeon]